MKDLAKRRRVMQRSMRLGHCICDARKPCPCDLFKDKDVCLCAGERMEAPAGPVRLTHLVQNAGCASKIDQASLKRIIEGLAFPADPRVLVGAAAGDDAGVYQLSDGTAIVQTVDVFTPSVDDPYLFGQVAAANSVSDIYAMGGRPLVALSIVGFPIGMVPEKVLHEILRGGIDKMAEAGVAVIGGHSIKDAEIKAGFAVTGVVDPKHLTLRAGARPGDVLVLTKPIGTGIVAFAAQIDRAPASALDAAARSMTTLNKAAAEAMLQFDAHGCTDITGFGLIGHLAEMAAGSRTDVEIVWDDIPLLPGVLELVGQGVIPGGVERNRESSGAAATLGKGVSQVMLEVCMDAQTSGGLLIAVPRKKADALLARLHARGVTDAAVIGKVRGKGAGRVFIETRGNRTIVETTLSNEPTFSREPNLSREPTLSREPKVSAFNESEPDMPKKSKDPCCCPDHGAEAAPATSTSVAQQKFKEFMKAVDAPGALDAHTKEAIALALAVMARCSPCVKNHVAKARSMGFSDAEIDEAAWMAIAFGGSPVMMFYNNARAESAAPETTGPKPQAAKGGCCDR
jgi:selenide,water dikinase